MVLDKKDKSYREVVSRISKVTLRQNNMEVSEGYEVDYIFPVSYGELLNLPPHVIADINNLQIITKEENSKKSNKCDSIPLFIQQYMLGITKEELDRRNSIRKEKGIEIAKSKGVYIGRVHGSLETIEKFISKPKNKKVIELLKEGKLKKVEISRIVGVNLNTITKLTKTIKDNNL